MDDPVADQPSPIVSITHVPVEDAVETDDVPAEEVESAPAEPSRSTPASHGAQQPVQQPPAKAASDSLTKELRMIEAARRSPARGDGAGAIKHLNDYGRQYPKGRLRAEASVLRIEALMAEGDRTAASRLGKALLKQSPNGPYARRIRSVLERGGVGPSP